jgi:hypothetical protein
VGTESHWHRGQRSSGCNSKSSYECQSRRYHTLILNLWCEHTWTRVGKSVGMKKPTINYTVFNQLLIITVMGNLHIGMKWWSTDFVPVTPTSFTVTFSKKKQAPACLPCNVPLPIEHKLIGCSNYVLQRQKHLKSCILLEDLLSSFSSRAIIDLSKESVFIANYSISYSHILLSTSCLGSIPFTSHHCKTNRIPFTEFIIN